MIVYKHGDLDVFGLSGGVNHASSESPTAPRGLMNHANTYNR